MSNHGVIDSARRRLLGGALAFAGGALAMPSARLLAAAGAAKATVAGFGPLKPSKDLNTGLPLLRLPEGFSYRTLGWVGEPLRDGTTTPPAHDGMGVVAVRGQHLLLVRNHELVNDRGAFGPASLHYDPVAAGGTVTLEIDAHDATLIGAHASLSGTLQNCAGGTTPWGTWLSCEEYVHETAAFDGFGGDNSARPLSRLTREHGFVFEVDPDAGTAPVRIDAMGQFRHEAVAVYAPTGDVYLTEDREPRGGFYRYVPNVRGKLAEGGRLQMLRAEGAADLRHGLRSGQRWNVSWVDIAEPGRGHTPRSLDGCGVVNQGLQGGASAFTRLEGCFAARDCVYFTSTNGGDAHCGQVFAYYPKRKVLELLFEADGQNAVRYPDNLCFSPRGGLVLCEDSGRPGQLLCGLTASGGTFPLAQNDVRLDGHQGLHGDFRGSEWAGCCFSPDGKWLFANVYNPGFTVAITGPWKQGLV